MNLVNLVNLVNLLYSASGDSSIVYGGREKVHEVHNVHGIVGKR